MLLIPIVVVLLMISGTVAIAPNQILQPAFAITFESTRNLSNNDGDSNNPQRDLHGSNVYIEWQDKTPGNFDILFKKGAD